MKNSEGRDCNRKDEGSTGNQNLTDNGYFTSAGRKRRHDAKDMLSNLRSPQRRPKTYMGNWTVPMFCRLFLSRTRGASRELRFSQTQGCHWGIVRTLFLAAI